jgi:hypothetical protein
MYIPRFIAPAFRSFPSARYRISHKEFVFFAIRISVSQPKEFYWMAELACDVSPFRVPHYITAQ